MAKLRRQLRLALNLYETVNQNRLKTGDPLTCELYPAGVEIQDTTTINSGIGVTTTFAVSGRGAIPPGTMVRIYQLQSGVWTDVVGNDLEFTSIEEQAGNEGVFNLTVTNQGVSAPNIAPGYKVACFRTSSGTTPIGTNGNLVDVYEDESDTADTITHPIDVPENGIVEGYVDWRGLDVYVTGTTITDNWYAFNVPTSSGETGPLRLKSESVTADTLTNIDADTSIVIVTAATNPIALLEHCAPGRVVIVYAATSGVQLSALATKNDNTIYESVPRTIDVTQDAPLMLVGQEASANVAYWAPLTAPIQFDIDLDTLTDVSTLGAVAGEVLGYNGSTWEPLSDLGTAAAPLSSLHIDTQASGVGLRITNGSGFDAQLGSASLTADRTYNFPNVADISSEIVVNVGTQSISGTKSFTVPGFQMVEGTKTAAFSLAAIGSGLTQTFIFPNQTGIFALTTDIPSTIGDIPDVTITGATAEDILRYNGSAWVNDKSIGTAANPMDQVIVDGERSSVGLTMVNDAGGTMQIADSELAAATGWDTNAYTALLPGRNGNILLDNTNLKHVTVNLPFNGTTDGLFAQLAVQNAIQIFRFNNDTPWAYETAYVITKVHYQWIIEGVAAAVTAPFELQVYANLGIPTTASVPPTGTTQMPSTIAVPSSLNHVAGTIDCWETTGTRNLGGVNFRHAIYLGRSGGTNGPTNRGMLTLTIEYIKGQARVKGSTEVDTTVAL